MPAIATNPDFPRIDRFDVLKMLGRGAQGTVFLATDTRLHRQVALKTLRAGGNDEAGANRQLAEARMVSGLHHPNIVTLFDAQHDHGATYWFSSLSMGAHFPT
jgi:eukaryotic-like serine/threonine-protein kinase